MARRLQRGHVSAAFAGLLLLWPACGGASVPTEASAPVLPAASPPMLAWAAGVTGKLNLDARQTEAFQRYLATFPSAPVGGPPLTAEQYRAMTQLQTLAFVTDRVALELAALRAQLDALRKFDALLTPEQRGLYEAIAKPGEIAGQLADEPPSENAPVAAKYGLTSHTAANWLVKPKGEELRRVYPTAARQRNVAGGVVLRCIAGADGFVSQCSVLSETPANQGFGNAALEMTAYMRMNPATEHGVPVPSPVNIPVSFAPNPPPALPIPFGDASPHP